MRTVLALTSAWLLGVAAVDSAHAHPPYRIAADPAGNVYLLDWATRRVLRVRPNGTHDVVVDFTARGVRSHPHAVAMGPDGRLHVAETYGRRIWIVADGEVRLHPWCGNPDDGLGAVQDIAFGPEGRLHILRRLDARERETRYVLQRLEADGDTTPLFETTAEAFQLYAACFAVGPDSTIWLSLGTRILRLEGNQLVGVAGSPKSGLADGKGAAARFGACYGLVARKDGTLLVADEDNHRIRLVKPDGHVTTLTDATAPYQVTVDAAGRVIVAEALSNPPRHRLRVIKGGAIETLATIAMGTPPSAERPARTLAEFRRISDGNVARSTVLELAGLHPVRDWPLSLWVKRAHETAKEQASDAPIFLNGVRHLEPSEAEALAAFDGSRIFLPDLPSIDAVTAGELARAKAALFLDGLKTLDVMTARALARSTGRRLSLRGLTTLTPALAGVLASSEGGLALDGVATIDVPTAKALSAWDGWGEQVLLSLGVRTLHADTAAAFARGKGWGVALDRLSNLSPQVANELAKLDTPYLSLGGLTSIPLETAQAIARWKRKFLTLEGVEHVTPQVRKLVEQGCEAVSWRGLRRGK